MTRYPSLRKIGLLASVLAFGLAAADNADAQYHHHGGHARFGVWVGGPLWWPGYGYGGYPYYPYPQAPIVIQQQPAEPAVTMVAPSAAQQSTTWYYCRDSKMYYPYASECASPWQEVPATPPPPAPPR